MAAITQPSSFGAHAGRRYGSFANKAGSSVVTGPYIVGDLAIFVPGKLTYATSSIFTPGPIDQATFTPGAVDQEIQT